jgi:hypothetical protein
MEDSFAFKNAPKDRSHWHVNVRVIASHVTMSHRDGSLSQSLSHSSTSTSTIMSDEWSPTIVIGSKAKAAKVTRNTSDLNGKGIPIFFVYTLVLIFLLFAAVSAIRFKDDVLIPNPFPFSGSTSRCRCGH